jgi:GTP cyclohydrolase I/GTP cyclohydrolase-4
VQLSRVGLTDVEQVVRIGVDRRSAQPFSARFECFLEPGPGPAAARFEDVIGEVVRELVGDDAGTRAERLAERVAERIRERHGAPRAVVTIAARFPERRPAPVSGAPTQEISTLHCAAVASEHGTRRMVGVSAHGMTTSPHPQRELVAGARRRLAADGFSQARIARILEAIPVATHDQLSVGALHVARPEGSALEFDAAELLDIVEGAMSTEIFELMKRGDEAAVVERAHRRPRFAEDCVGAMIADVVGRFAGVPDDVFVSASVGGSEAIQGRTVVAERAGPLGDLRRSGQPSAIDSAPNMRR